MRLHKYQPHELSFAFCYRVYFSWKTSRGQSIPKLKHLARSTLDALLRPYNIRVLVCATDETVLRCIVSLHPIESISACASKLKGRLSHWLSEQLELTQPTSLLSKGYSACTVGKAKGIAIER